VDDGHTVIVIEHNLSVIAEADYIVDIGPEAGDAGGEIVAAGTPEQVAKNRTSRTAPFLREVLATKNRGVASVPVIGQIALVGGRRRRASPAASRLPLPVG
jgi:hypothetical protein